MRLRDLLIKRYPDPAVERVHEWIGHLASDDEVADLLYSRFARFSGVGLVAVQQEAIVGFCGWQQDEGFALLGPVLVRRDKQKWGTGSHLVDLAIDEMREAGIRTIESTYRSGDQAGERLFKRCGFRSLGAEHCSGVEWTRVERVLKKTR